MKIRKIVSLIAIIITLNWYLLPITVEASVHVGTNQKKNSSNTNIWMERDENEFKEYINNNFKKNSRKVKSVKETELYRVYQKNNDEGLYNEIKEIGDLKSEEIREMVCYLGVKKQEDGGEICKIFNENEFKEYIEENNIELDNDYLEDCSWEGGKSYSKTTSDTYMKLVFTSVRNNANHNKYSMMIYFEWLKQPVNCEFDNYLCFGHDSNITVDNDSIRFYFYHYKKVIFSGTESSNTLYYDVNSPNVSADTNGIKVRFDIGYSAGIYTDVEKRHGYLKFNARFANKNVESAQLYFSYYQPYFSMEAIWSDAISIATNGKISISAFTTGCKYVFSNEFVRK